MIAAALAHELAHLALHEHSTAPHAVKEREADTRGVLYFERAGLDCRRWVLGMGRWYGGGYPEERAVITAACEAARQ
jgi:hypothetical protein